MSDSIEVLLGVRLTESGLDTVSFSAADNRQLRLIFTGQMLTRSTWERIFWNVLLLAVQG